MANNKLSKNTKNHSILIAIFVLIGLADDPREEIADILPALGQHLDRNHVEHLNGLVELNV